MKDLDITMSVLKLGKYECSIDDIDIFNYAKKHPNFTISVSFDGTIITITRG